MASLTGQLVAETYKALLKTIDNDILTASEKQITDGFGGGSNVFIDSQGFLRANKYKVTNGLSTQFLKADGSLDSNTYLTGITSSQIISALGYTPVTNARTLTINGTTYDLSANRSWTIEGTAAVWGNISGTLSNQTDLQNALNAKFDDPTGTISQYIRGDGSIANFPSIAGGLPTGGTAGQILAKIDATDYNAHWIDNYATQTKNEVKLGQTLTKGTPVYVSSANGTNMIVSAASNASEATSSKTLGLLETGGATNDLVKCVTFGLLAGLDTSTATAGDPVWLGVNGALIFGLANKPYAPAHLVYIGVVTRVQSNNGEIFVNVQNGFELKEIHDVSAQSPTNNDGLFFETSTGLWKNKSIATVLGYTPQAQLNGTGFVKASGTTITYDNSTYLTTADAASTYLALTGGTLTGNLTISNANPKLFLTDTDNNPDYSIQNYNGTFKITDETNSADRFFIYSTGIGYYNGDFKANKLYIEGGTSSQFLKGDGTLDTNTYLTSASLDGYLAKAGGTMSGDLNFYTLKTTRVGGNAYIRGSWQGTYWGIGAAATGHTIIIDQVDFSTGAYESITDVNLMLGTRTVLHSGNYSSYALPITGGTVTGSITATSFVKSGGTASQFLMADGSVSTLSSPVTGSGSAGYIPKWTSASNVGSSNISDDGTSIGIAYTTPNKGGYGRTLTGAAFGSASFGFEAVGGTTTNGGLLGGLSFIVAQNDSSRIVGSAIQSNLVGTTATNYGADLRFYAKADAGVIAEVARMTSAGLRVYGTIVKDGGTSSQFLMADGSVSTLTGVVTGSGTATRVAFFDGTNSITSSSGLYWDNSAGRLAVGKNSADARLEVYAGTKGQIRANGGTAMGGGVDIYTELSGTGRRNWGVYTEVQTPGDMSFLMSASAGVAPTLEVLTMQATGIGSYKYDFNVVGKLGAADDKGLYLRSSSDVTHKIYYKTTSGYNNAIWEYNSTLFFQYYAAGTPVTRASLTIDGNFWTQGTLETGGNVGIRIAPSATFALITANQGITGSNAYFGTGGVRIGGGEDHLTNTVLSVAPGVVNFDRPGVGGGALKIFSDGNIGINQTTNGGRKLEIQTNSTSAALWVQTGGTTSGYTIADFRTGTNASALQLLGNANAIFGGSVVATGFETTSANNGKFGINDNGSDGTQYRFYQFSTSGTTYVINTQMGASGEYDIWQYSGAWRRNFRMTGLGAATFSNSLNVQNMVTISSASSINAPSSGKSIEMVYRTDGSNDYAFIQTYDRTNSIFKPLRISGSSLILNGGGEGNVGIGTTSPNSNSRLHVYRGGGSYDTIIADGDIGTNTGYGIYEGGSARYALYSNGAGGNDSFNIYNFGAAANSFTMTVGGNIGFSGTPYSYAKLNIFDTGVVITNGNAIAGTNMKGVFVENTNNGDESIGVWFRTGSNHLSGISGQRDDNTAGWGTDLRFYTHERATQDLPYAKERMRLTTEGYLLIGTRSISGYRLEVSGSVVASAYYESSDLRLKNVFKKYDSNNFGAIEFNWLDKRDTKNHWGYIAQDVQKCLPDAVNMGKDGFLSVDYNQAHTYKIAKVEDEITTLKKRVAELEKQLNLN